MRMVCYVKPARSSTVYSSALATQAIYTTLEPVTLYAVLTVSYVACATALSNAATEFCKA
jgi:hypothetical protein